MKYITTQEQLDILVSELKHTSNRFILDTESPGLYLPVRLVQLMNYNTDEAYLVDASHTDITELLLVLQRLYIIGHNLNYDLTTLNVVPNTIDDTLLLSKVKYPELVRKDRAPFGLKKMAKFLGSDVYDNIDEDTAITYMPTGALTQEQIDYAYADLIATKYVYDKVVDKSDNDAYKLNCEALLHAIYYQRNGLEIDVEGVEAELVKSESIYKAYTIALDGLNPNSYTQVRAKLTEMLGYTFTKSDAKGMQALINNLDAPDEARELAELIIKTKKQRLRITNLKKYRKPKVFTIFNPAGAATNRFTAKGAKTLPNHINAQNITRDLQYLFNKDTHKTSVVHADYSTAELRAGCSIMGDETMRGYLMEGVDLHKVAAAMASGCSVDEVDKAGRQKGKAINFGFIFGMGAESFIEYAKYGYNVDFTMNEAKLIKHKYQKTYPAIAKYADRMWKTYNTSLVSTPMGWVRAPQLGTDAINHATQGCIAETTKCAIEILVAKHPDALDYIYNVVHDAIYLRVPKHTEKLWADRLVHAMKGGWQEMCKYDMLKFKDIPMPVEVEYLDVVEEL